MPQKLTFFRTYYEIAERLADADRLAFYDAILRYVFSGVEPDLDGALSLVFMAVRPNLDASVNGSRGGRGKKAETSSETVCESDEKGGSENLETPSAKHEKGVSENRKSPGIGKDRKGKGKEGGVERGAAADAAAAGAAPPSALCPLCEVPMRRNTNTGRFECPSCHDTWSKDEAVWR